VAYMCHVCHVHMKIHMRVHTRCGHQHAKWARACVQLPRALHSKKKYTVPCAAAAAHSHQSLRPFPQNTPVVGDTAELVAEQYTVAVAVRWPHAWRPSGLHLKWLSQHLLLLASVPDSE
jgi:hypothetical protein